MKKAIAFAAVLGIVMLCLNGCSIGFIGGSAVRYDHAEEYTAGDREITDKIDRIDTSSGDLSCGLSMSKTGDETYSCGDGSSKLSIETSSGDVKIYKR